MTMESPPQSPCAKANTKNKRQKREKPVPTKPALFHDQFSSEIAQRLVRDTSGLDPISILDRISGSASAPESNTQTITTAPPSEKTTLIVEQRTYNSSERLSNFTLDEACKTADNKPKSRKIPKFDGTTFNLDHFAALAALTTLIEKHGRISHMGILDPSYSFFMNEDRNAALYYRAKNQIALVGGNPLCELDRVPALLAEFERFRRRNGLGIAFLGASGDFADYAREQKGWVSMRFGIERALNPMTNKVLKEQEGKRIVKQCKQLLDPARGGMRVNVYVPWQKQDLELQAKLVDIYETWRESRNSTGKPQAYMTVFDPFALPQLMVYLYTSGPDGKPNGFAALRRMNGGYHIDPYCALPDAPRGTTDLLIFSALALLNRAKVPYLGLGFEPTQEVSDIHGLSPTMTRMTESAYRRILSRLPIFGKKAFYDRWYPEENLDAGLYIIYPNGRPGLRHSLATMHFANVCVREILTAEIRDSFKFFGNKTKEEDDPKPQTQDPKTNSVRNKERKSAESQTSSFYSGIRSVSQLSVIFGGGSKQAPS